MLFRAQALSHAQQDQAEGRILIRSPRILWGCSIASMCAAAAIAALLFTAHYTPPLRLSGQLRSAAAAQLLVPAAALPHIRAGQRIPVHFPGTGQHGHATVSSVMRANDSGPARYQVLLIPDAQPSLRAGMEIEASIVLPNVRLLDWIVK
jgi:hypothetical protein